MGRPFITGKRDEHGFVQPGSVKVGAQVLRNEGEVNENWSSCGFEWGYSGQGPRCLAYSIGVAYFKRKRKLARWLLAEEYMDVFIPLVSRGLKNGKDFELYLAEIDIAISNAELAGRRAWFDQ